MLTSSGSWTVADCRPSFWGFCPRLCLKQGFTSETAENNRWVERMRAVQFLTSCQSWGRHPTVIVCFSSWNRTDAPLGSIKPEKDVFDVDFNIGRTKPDLNDQIQDEEDVRLVPRQWRFFQDDIHRSNSQKKLALRLRAREEELQRAEELRLKRQQLEEAGKLLKERLRQQRTMSNEDKIMGHCAVESENVLSSDILVTSNISREVEVAAKAPQTSTKGRFDSQLNRLFTEDEIACLKGGPPELSKFNCEKWPPLHVLVAAGQFFFLEEYLKSDLDLNLVDEDGYTPIHRAILGRKETAVSQLLRAGADPFVLDKDGASFLHYSTQIGSLNLVRLFVKCRVDVNHPDKDGWTALHIAVLTAREDVVRHLLLSGADKHLKTKDGHTAFDLCLAIGRGYKTFGVAKSIKRLPKTQPSSEIELDVRSSDTGSEVEEDFTLEEGMDAFKKQD